MDLYGTYKSKKSCELLKIYNLLLCCNNNNVYNEI